MFSRFGLIFPKLNMEEALFYWNRIFFRNITEWYKANEMLQRKNNWNKYRYSKDRYKR